MNTSETSGPNPTVCRPRRKGTPMVNPPLTPLIDVFLFLIIFFLLGCKFMQYEGTIPANLPRTGGPGDEVIDFPPDPIRVSLAPGADGGVRIRIGGIMQARDLADMAALRRVLSEFRDRFGTGSLQEPRPVYIQPSRGVQWGAVTDAFNQAVGAGFSQVGVSPSGAKAI